MGGVGRGRHREVDLPYLEWVRGLKCAVAERGYRPGTEWTVPLRWHRCGGSVQAHHVKTRGARGSDKTAIPLCAVAHRQWHEWGRQTFQRRYGLDAWALVATLRERYVPREVAF